MVEAAADAIYFDNVFSKGTLASFMDDLSLESPEFVHDRDRPADRDPNLFESVTAGVLDLRLEQGLDRLDDSEGRHGQAAILEVKSIEAPTRLP